METIRNGTSRIQGIKAENDNPHPEEEQEIIEFETKSFSRRPDPASLYLKEIRSFPLLTREREIEIARRIKTGKREILNGLLESMC